ncbi:MAG: GGDEF domain-containing protein [Desulfobacterales bacterium]
MQNQPTRSFHNRALALLNLVWGAKKGSDYKVLNHYILKINQTRSLEGILLEVGGCLKALLNYKMFAFAIQDAEKLTAWVDPRVSRSALKNILQKDFSQTDNLDVCLLRQEPEALSALVTFNAADLLSYVLLDGECAARLYVLPERRMFAYHQEILQTLVKTLGIALSNLMTVKHLENAAAVDPLTNCYNRRVLDRQLTHQVANAHRYGQEVSLIMFDLDHFKQVNDRYGHQAGDRVLQQVAETVLGSIRKGDYLARYGGEEFVVILPETKKLRAMELAERLRAKIANLVVGLPDGRSLSVTASFGVSAIRQDLDETGFIREADTMLYKAKAAGRNTVMPSLKLCSAAARLPEAVL